MGRTQNVLGEKGRRIRELTSVVQKRFNFPENSVDLYAEKVATRGLCAILKLNHFVTSLSEVWLCVVLVMVSSVSLWNLVPKVARSLCQENFVDREPKP